MDKETWDSRYAATPAMWSADPNLFIKDHFSNRSFSKVIDLAGGEGRNAIWFALQGAEVENVEISAVALQRYLDRAQALGVSELTHATEADATNNPVFTLQQSDVLIISYLQLPKAQLATAVSNAVAQLGEGAEVFGVWHAVENLTHGYGGPPNIEYLVSPDQLLELANDLGLKNIIIEPRDRIVDVAGESKIAKDVVLIANR